MSNSTCLSGPAFSITGDLLFIDQQVEFQLSFNSEADQAESGSFALTSLDRFSIEVLVPYNTPVNFTVYAGAASQAPIRK